MARAGAWTALLGLALAGCFTSPQPLISPAMADHPLARTGHFTESINCAAAGQLVCDAKTGFKQIAAGVISTPGGRYQLSYDKDSNPVLSLTAAQNAPPPMLMFKSIGDDLYVAQVDTAQTDPAMADALPRYLYSLVRIKDGAAFIYKYSCEENGDLRFVRSGQLGGIVSPIGVPMCQAKSIAGLAAVFRDRLANGLPPDEKIEVR